MIQDQLKQEITKAMKARDEVRVSTLRMLSSELHNKRIEKQSELSKEDELEVIQREVKKRKDAIEAYEKAQAEDKISREKKELEILQEFLPRQLTDDELENLISEAITKTSSSDTKDTGKVIGYVLSRAKGKVEGARVAKRVREKLTKE